MPGHNWKAITEELRNKVCLPAYPVGVKLLEKPRELLDYRDARLLTDTTPCHMAAIARYNRAEGLVGASSQGTKCLWGAACLGLVRTPERLSEGDLNLPFTQNVEAARRLHENMYMLGNAGKRFSGVIMAPLDIVPFDPDVIVMYMSPARALRLVIAFAYARGEVVSVRMTGQASLCSAIARAVDAGAVTVDVPCMGDRAYGLVQESEVVVAFPAPRIEELMEGLRETEGTASYPYKPFLRWPAIFPPSMEPREVELDQ
ncbi:MAG: DUF169 domain-containing protein [Methanomassiliicoccus sp.]|nr:DUF169 domain-containing protein [Methanomassiliicoccus sp.]